jgi:hypothetical protein
VRAVVETAFGLLMRLPQRLEAERGRANDALSAYLEDPLKFFIQARLVRGLLFQVGPKDPLVFAVVTVSLAAAGFCACVVPARRATMVDPVVALRSERGSTCSCRCSAPWPTCSRRSRRF